MVATVAVSLFMAWTLYGMIRDVLGGHVGLDVLAVVAMVATLCVGEFVAALIIVLMLAGGEALEDYAARRATRDLTSLLDRSPRIAHVERRDADAVTRITDVAADDVAVGDVVVVRPGEIVPMDGRMLSASGSFDESSLTGESMPVTHSSGDEIMSGTINGAQAVRLAALRRSVDSQYQQIVALVRTAAESRGPVVRLADRFAVPFTALALVLAITAAAIAGDARRFAEVLVLATPCPLLIAAPVAFLGGLSRAAKRGVIMKGGAVLETLDRVKSAAFDKTGTLTRGTPELIDVRASGMTADEALQMAASAEQSSSHVLAAGIRRAAQARGIALLPTEDAVEVATDGITAIVAGRRVAVGKSRFIASLAPDFIPEALRDGESAAYLAVGGIATAALVLADAARSESAPVVGWLRAHGVARVVMLTGDARSTAESIARRVGIDEVHADLLPGEKVRLAIEMTPRPMMMVGDGVNDAPVLAAADVGIAMGARGATAAGDAADIVILVDSLVPVADAVSIAHRTVRIALTAIWIGIGLSVALMLIAMTGAIPAIAGAITQEAVDVATILYALRAVVGPATEGLTAPGSGNDVRISRSS